jgi:hypothetical protein
LDFNDLPLDAITADVYASLHFCTKIVRKATCTPANSSQFEFDDNAEVDPAVGSTNNV